jgi:hypothetical protein
VNHPEPTPAWRHRAVEHVDSPLAAVGGVTFEEAQPWCNFVVLAPTVLPRGHAIGAVTLRREVAPGRMEHMDTGRSPWSHANPSALRYEIGDGARRLRVKEFLYDWAPPAGDQPCLWESEVRAVDLDDRYVVWLGTDYAKRPGAYARVARTSVELSVLEGDYGDGELAALYASLHAVDPRAYDRIARTSFAHLSYWARYDVPLLDVPTGLLTFRRKHRAEDVRWAPDATGLGAPVALPGALDAYRLDAVGRFESPDGAVEHEFVYTTGIDRGHELRLVVQAAGQGRIQVPAPVEDHPCTVVRRAVAGRDVQVAYVDEHYGPFDAVWHDPGAGVDVKALLSAAVGSDLERCDAVLTAVMEGLRP